MDAGDAEAKAAKAAAVLAAVHSPTASPSQLEEARELYDKLRDDTSASRVAAYLAKEGTAPELQHFAFQLLTASVRAKKVSQTDRNDAKAWIVDTVLGSESRWATCPVFVRTKAAEAVAELAKADWPKSWPSLTAALHKATTGETIGALTFALSVWSHLAEIMGEETKDIDAKRKKELNIVFKEQMDVSQDAPPLVRSLQAALKRHGGDRGVVTEALRLCKALATPCPVPVLWMHNLDKIIQVGLESPELRGAALVALAEWLERAQPKAVDPGTHLSGAKKKEDLRRFAGMVVALAKSCSFAGDQHSYAFHRQVAELLAELCEKLGQLLLRHLHTGEQTEVWATLLQLLRYPSADVQVVAATGLLSLAKALQQQVEQSSREQKGRGKKQGKQEALTALFRPPLEPLVGTLFVLCLKNELLPPVSAAFHADRSKWLLECLGASSSSEQPGTFQAWRALLAKTTTYEIKDQEGDSALRSGTYGDLKARAFETMKELCRPAGDETARGNYVTLCRICAELVSRALQHSATAGPDDEHRCAAEYDAAVLFVEQVASVSLKQLEKPGKDGKSNAAPKEMLEPTLAFIQHATAASGGASSTSLEIRRLEFLSAMGGFLKHFPGETCMQVVQKVLSTVKNPTEGPAAGCHFTFIQRRALDTFISLGKHGALLPEKLDAIQVECQAVSASLTPESKSKICQALTSAVLSAPTTVLPMARKAQLTEALLEPATVSWQQLEALVNCGVPDGASISAAHSVKLATLLVAGAASDAGKGDENFGKLRQVRVLLQMFTSIASKVATVGAQAPVGNSRPKKNDKATTDPEPPADTSVEQSQIMHRVAQLWAPGVFQLAFANLGLMIGAAQNPESPMAKLLSKPSPHEETVTMGKKETAPAGEGEDDKGMATSSHSEMMARNVVFEVHGLLAKAIRACIVSGGFWTLPTATPWLRTVAEALRHQRPHVVELFLREVFMPLFTNEAGGGASAGNPWPGLTPVPLAGRREVCKGVLPTLLASLAALVRNGWKLPTQSEGDKQPAFLPIAQAHEGAYAQSLVSFTRQCAVFVAGTVGAKQQEAARIVDPERRLFGRQAMRGGGGGKRAAPEVVGRKGKRRRNHNSFGALNDEDEDEDESMDEGGRYLEDDGMDRCLEALPSHLAVAYLMRDSELRMAGLKILTSVLLHVPDRETMSKALNGLAIWVAQLWRLAALEGDVEALHGKPHSGERKQVEVGELIHAATAATRALPAGLLKPATAVVCSPPALKTDGSGGEESDSWLAAISSVVRQPWTEYCCCAKASNGKLGPAPLVQDAAAVAHSVFSVLGHLLQLQCRKLQLKTSLEHLYLCPAMNEATKVCKALPNTTEADVTSIFNMAVSNAAKEEQKAAVRALLHEASAAFLSATEGGSAGCGEASAGSGAAAA
eukprot:TRINITY_DN8274_c0_g2_i1.p1 TRINITY_DN8274_c0_g2~~TRINITY_DN8274_c0_g2_i1.p1  ORF type:complete len:1407 (-),score=399.09 TRINITY_DN8274_c0_g2_i1:191-4411(-)